MAIKAKIKIRDIDELRENLDQIYEDKSQINLAKWALQLSKHIFALVEYDYGLEPTIADGFAVNEKWQSGEARMHDVRQAGFRVHQLAKESKDPVLQAALRVAGQAIGTGHMREHAMVASDYAVKVINLLYVGDLDAAKNEREWQIQTMLAYINVEDIIVSKIDPENQKEAMALALSVFMKYEAPDYCQQGIKTFTDFVSNKETTESLETYGAFYKGELIGVISTRNAGNHISLFFVSEKYHRQGIGRMLFAAVVHAGRGEKITVNSSPYRSEE